MPRRDPAGTGGLMCAAVHEFDRSCRPVSNPNPIRRSTRPAARRGCQHLGRKSPSPDGCKNLHFVHDAVVSIQEIETEIEALPTQERKRLAAFLVSLRHKEIAEYRTRMARKIDDKNPENWATLEELDQRLES